MQSVGHILFLVAEGINNMRHPKPNTQNFVTLRANAKINLALQVVGKRPDGYHDLRMVMQTLLLHDTIFIKKIDSAHKIKLTSDAHWLPTDKRNLVYRAIDLLQKNYDIPGGVFVEIGKNIPVSAGLGGGSADCAAALIGMRRLYNLNLPMAELRQIGKELGADIPYLLTQGTAMAEGIGERITRLTPHPYTHVLLAKPKFSVSTKAVFSRVDMSAIPNHSDKFDQLLHAIDRQNIAHMSKHFFNDLEPITASRYPIIYDIKKAMTDHGALASMMSGSGPTVFGYFRSRQQANSAARYLRSQGVRDLHLTGIFNRKPRI